MSEKKQFERMLRVPNLVAQGTSILAWLVSVQLNPFLETGVSPQGWLAAGSMLVASVLYFLAQASVPTRLVVLFFAVSQAYAFRQQGLAMGDEVELWLMPTAMLITLGSTILFSRQLDYLTSSVLVWLLLLGGHLDLFQAEARPLVMLVVSISLLSGLLLNYAFVRAVGESLRLNAIYRSQARTDSLTGIGNRRALMEALEAAFAESPLRAHYFIMLDIDDFKRINDQHGHDVGDLVIRQIAQALARHFPRDTFGRLGGEEFGILIQSDDSARIGARLLGLLTDVRSQEVVGAHYTFSAGVARSSDAASPSELLRQADQALYLAKRAGKNRAYMDGRPFCRTEADTRPAPS